MKSIKNLFIILTCFSMHNLMPIQPRGGKQQPAASIEQEIAAELGQITQKKTFKELLQEASTKDNAVDNNGRLTKDFIVWAMSNAIASNLDLMMTQMLLQAGVSYHGQFEEDAKGPGSIMRLTEIEAAIATHAKQYPTLLIKYEKDVKAAEVIPGRKTYTEEVTQVNTLESYLTKIVDNNLKDFKEAINTRQFDILVEGFKNIIYDARVNFDTRSFPVMQELKKILKSKIEMNADQSQLIEHTMSNAANLVGNMSIPKSKPSPQFVQPTKTKYPMGSLERFNSFINTILDPLKGDIRASIMVSDEDHLSDVFFNIIQQLSADFTMPVNAIAQAIKDALVKKITIAGGGETRTFDTAMKTAVQRFQTEQAKTTATQPAAPQSATQVYNMSTEMKAAVIAKLNDSQGLITPLLNRQTPESIKNILDSILLQLKATFPSEIQDIKTKQSIETLIINTILEWNSMKNLKKNNETLFNKIASRISIDTVAAMQSLPRSQRFTFEPLPKVSTATQPPAPYQSATIQTLGSEQAIQARLNELIKKDDIPIQKLNLDEQLQLTDYLQNLIDTLSKEFPSTSKDSLSVDIQRKITSLITFDLAKAKFFENAMTAALAR